VITHTKHVNNISESERVASVLAGAILAVLGMRRWRSASGVGLVLVGGDLIRRGITGRSYLYECLGVRTTSKGEGAETTSVPYELGIRVDQCITIEKPREEVFQLWHNVENLPRFMHHLQSVRTIGGNRSHWVAKGPLGKVVEWDAEIVQEEENRLFSWRSLAESDVDHAGSVRFADAPGGRGTEIRVELQYTPPGGILGGLAAKLSGQEPAQQIREDLRRLKQILEAGEAPTTQEQSSGRKEDAENRYQRERVLKTSEESFPAIDPSKLGVGE